MSEMNLTELSAAEMQEIDGGDTPREVVDPTTGRVVIIGCTEPMPTGWSSVRAQY